MITEAIQATLTGLGYDSYPLSAVQDDVSLPFVVHEESADPEEQSKDEAAAGTNTYQWAVRIGIFASKPDYVLPITAAIQTAIVALAGSTVNETEIEESYYDGELSEYDEEIDAYYTLIEFVITTKNR